MRGARWIVLVIAVGLISGCSTWGGQSIGDVFAEMVRASDEVSTPPPEKTRLRQIEQSIPQDAAAAGTQMGIDQEDAAVEADPSDIVRAVDLRGWDVAGLRFGMVNTEVSDALTTRGYTLEHGAVWRRSADRVATEFGPNGLMRAMSATLLPTETDAEREVEIACQSARAAVSRRGCTSDSGGAAFEVSMAPSEDGWVVLRQMKIDRAGQLN